MRGQVDPPRAEEARLQLRPSESSPWDLEPQSSPYGQGRKCIPNLLILWPHRAPGGGRGGGGPAGKFRGERLWALFWDKTPPFLTLLPHKSCSIYSGEHDRHHLRACSVWGSDGRCAGLPMWPSHPTCGGGQSRAPETRVGAPSEEVGGARWLDAGTPQDKPISALFLGGTGSSAWGDSSPAYWGAGPSRTLRAGRCVRGGPGMSGGRCFSGLREQAPHQGHVGSSQSPGKLAALDQCV